MKWNRKRVLVTGGAGFIGSNLVSRLLILGADVLIVDKLQLSSRSRAWNRKLAWLEQIFKKHGLNKVPFEIVDLQTERDRFQLLCKDVDVVFHLSAMFGGREFVDTRQAECSKMLAIDHNVIEAACEASVERFHYASRACVYPPSLQRSTNYLLKEDDILSTGEGWNTWPVNKPNTNVVEESQALHLVHSLLEFGCDVNVFDPVSMDVVKDILSEKVRYCTSASECVKESDFVILATPWQEFRKIPIELFHGKCILDCWRFLPSKIGRVAKYVAVGVSSKF